MPCAETLLLAHLATLVLICAFQAGNITGRSLHVVLIAIPLVIQGYWLLVIQVHWLREMWLESTACSILHDARVPVLLARIEITAEERAGRCRAACAELFRHVLFPTDFSDIAERAFQYRQHIVREAHPAVTQRRGFIREILLGGVAHNMAPYAPLPALFVPPGRRGSGGPTTAPPGRGGSHPCKRTPIATTSRPRPRQRAASSSVRRVSPR